MKKININSNNMSNKDSKNKELEDTNVEKFKPEFNVVEFTMRDSSGMIVDKVAIKVNYETNKINYKYFTEYWEFMPNGKSPFFSYDIERDNTIDNNLIFLERFSKLINHSVKTVVSTFKDIKKHNEKVISKELDIAIDIKKGTKYDV